MSHRPASVNIMVRAAEKASKLLIRDFNEIDKLQYTKKSPQKFMETAIENAAQTMAEDMRYTRSECSLYVKGMDDFIGVNTDEMFIINPLEGRMNFLHGLPFWCMTLAFVKNGKTKASVIYDPYHDNVYWAQFGNGAYDNTQRLEVTKRASIKTASLVTHLPPFQAEVHQEHQKTYLKQLHFLSQKGASIRDFGCTSLALAFVAAGRFDAFWGYDVEDKYSKAAELIVQEARGQTYRFAEDSGMCGLVATTESYMPSFQKLLS